MAGLNTTTIRILMTLLRPTQGRAWVAGHDVLQEPLEAMRRVGFMPENPGFYAALTDRQHLRYYASLYGMSRSELDGRIDGLLARVGMAEAADRKVKTYSLGMKLAGPQSLTFYSPRGERGKVGDSLEFDHIREGTLRLRRVGHEKLYHGTHNPYDRGGTGDTSAMERHQSGSPNASKGTAEEFAREMPI